MPEDELRYDVKSAHPRWLRWAPVFAGVMALLNFVLNLARGEPERSYGLLALAVVAGLVFLVMRLRPQEVVVDRDGVRMPLRGTTPWNRIRSIRPPGPYVAGVVLVREDGSEVLTPLPPQYIERVASIGEKPLE